MKITKLPFLFILLSIVGCNTQVNPVEEIKKQVKQLETTEAKKLFLEKILEDDQKVRDSEKAAHLMMTYGKDSEEHMEYVRAQWKQDEINLIKVEAYLDTFGHPKKSEVGDAADAPWLVIHHAQGYDVRERNFERIYEAYLRDDIDDGAISFYMGRMYQMKNGKRLDMENPFTTEDEVNRLIKELNLEEKQANVQQRMHGK